MPLKRTQTLGTRVTEAEYLRLEKLAGRQSMSDWMRSILLNVGETTAKDEVLALRMIIINVMASLSTGEKMTHETMAKLIEIADSEKAKRVASRMNNG